jgi:hypothetical protein
MTKANLAFAQFVNSIMVGERITHADAWHRATEMKPDLTTLMLALGATRDRIQFFNTQHRGQCQPTAKSAASRVDAGTLQPSGSAAAVFRQRGYWAAKNTRQETSRDRFTGLNLGQAVADLEGKLAALGCGAGYCATIRKNVCKGRDDARALHLYQAALERTLKAKAKRAERAEDPY